MGPRTFFKQYENFSGVIVLQFVGRLLSGSMVRLMVTSSKRTYATGCDLPECPGVWVTVWP